MKARTASQLFTICNNAGIGYETALALASKGYATVLARRDMNKAGEARDRIRCTVFKAVLALPSLLASIDTLQAAVWLHLCLPPQRGLYI